MWHTEHASAVVEKFRSNAVNGLTQSEVRVRVERYGLNKIAGRKKRPLVRLFFAQLNSILIFILLFAAVVSAVLGETTDTIVIACVIMLNALIGVIQEAKAEKALEALRRLATPRALVVREGGQREVPAEEVVPGDIVVIDAGRIIPCDIRLIESVNLKIEESSLTGESVPVEKRAGTVNGGEDTPLGDRRNMAFMSTIATYGRGIGIAVATGMSTEIGKIAVMLEENKEELTPLQKKLELLGRRLGGIILGLCACLFLISLLRPLIVSGMIEKSHLIELLLTAISLAVAAIPEGLPAIVTIVLAIGVQRMVRRNAIIRSLPAVETLGSVNIICTDKTGTLTLNKMTVTRFFADGMLGDIEKLDRANSAHRMLLHSIVLCNDATFTPGARTGDPTEVALVEAGYQNGMVKGELESTFPRVAEKPFDSERKLMSTVHKYGGKYTVFTKGALDQIINKCTRVITNEGTVPLTEKIKEQLLEKANELEALRILAGAYRETEKIPGIDGMEEDLIFAGFVGMIDPPRLEVKDSIARCRKSGIQTVMITGDHKNTALSIARALDIAVDPSQIISATELEALSDDELRRRSHTLRVYARVSPEHKVRIVRALKAMGNIVSMTGDGVNDAPSLKAADIGVAMGITGTDVAKGASDMVLTDDNYSTIVAAIEEGRNIYNNIRKSVLFLLSCNAGEIIAIFLSILFGWPTPLIPIHILWVNLITDTLPALALGMDPGDPNVLDEKPRDPAESLFSRGGTASVIGNGLLIGLLTLFAFRFGMRLYPQSLVHARTLAFAVLSLTQLFHAFNMRHQTKSLFGIGPFSNLFLIGAVVVGIVLQVSVIGVPLFASIFRVLSLYARDWLFVAVLATMPLLFNEVVKIFLRHRTSK
jgi:Ca2+-transporting ATPase